MTSYWQTKSGTPFLDSKVFNKWTDQKEMEGGKKQEKFESPDFVRNK